MRSLKDGSVKQSKRYWYYTSRRIGPDDDRALDRIPAVGLETIAEEAMRNLFGDHAWLATSLRAVGASPEAIGNGLDRANESVTKIADAPLEPEILSRLIHRMDLTDAVLLVQLNLAFLLDQPEASDALAPPVEVPITLRRSGRNRPIVLRAVTDTPHRDPDLIALIADARRWMNDLIDGRVTTVAEIIKREQLRPGNVSRVLPLAWLAPDIAAAILEGKQPSDLTAKKAARIAGTPTRLG